MVFFLIAQAEPAKGLTPFLKENWLVLLPVVLGFAAIYLLLPQARRVKPIWGGVLAAVALIFGAGVLIRTDALLVEALLFYAFAGIAISGGVMMITQKNPVHAALSFALVVLSTCGLFLLQAAPFLMAATIIIYAGAIVVTFLFVIMLAQQEGVSNADQRSREPFLASLAGCILMASLLCILQRSYGDPPGLDDIVRDLQQLADAKDEADIKRVLGDPSPSKTKTGEMSRPLVENLKKHFAADSIHSASNNLQIYWAQMDVAKTRKSAELLLTLLKAHRQTQGSLSLEQVPGKEANKAPSHFGPGKLPAGNVAALGRTLFTDYLIAVELAATLLLVATIGAIAIAGRRSEELR
jgi:NADH-quinone oxidoreductase subunit J